MTTSNGETSLPLPYAVFTRKGRGPYGYSGKVSVEDEKLGIDFQFNYHRMVLLWGEELSVYLERSELGEIRRVTGL